MNIEDILIDNIEYNKTAEETDKKPERILRFFRVYGKKIDKNKFVLKGQKQNQSNIDNGNQNIISDSLSNYKNICKIDAKYINDILNSVYIDSSKKYSSITDLKNDADEIINKINNIINKQFITEYKNEELNQKINAYLNGDLNENIYILSNDIFDDIESNKIIYIPKEYYIYSEIDKDNILNKFNQINNEEI